MQMSPSNRHHVSSHLPVTIALLPIYNRNMSTMVGPIPGSPTQLSLRPMMVLSWPIHIQSSISKALDGYPPIHRPYFMLITLLCSRLYPIAIHTRSCCIHWITRTLHTV